MILNKIKEFVELFNLGLKFSTLRHIAHGKITEQEIDSLFEKFNDYYQKSAKKLLINNENEMNNAVFHLSSAATALIFGYRGDYQTARRICEFAIDNTPYKYKNPSEIPGAKKNSWALFKEMIPAFDLRLLLLEIEKTHPHLNSETIHINNYAPQLSQQLKNIQRQLTDEAGDAKKTGKPGENALLHFVMGDVQKANEYLEQLYQKGNGTKKFVEVEIFENTHLAKVSPMIGKNYIEFVKDFIESKDNDITQIISNSFKASLQNNKTMSHRK